MKKLILLGDSISLGYGSFLMEFLREEYQIISKQRVPTQDAVGGGGGDSYMVLEHIKERDLEHNFDAELFVFNCGLWDVRRQVPEEDYRVSMECYKKNLEESYRILTTNGIRTMFITTTPIDELRHNTEIPAGIKRYNSDICKYNDAAINIAKKYNAGVIDLFKFTKNIDGNKYCDYAHFNEEVRKIQAAYIAGVIMGHQ